MRRIIRASTGSTTGIGSRRGRGRAGRLYKPLSKRPEGIILRGGHGPTKKRFPTFQLPDVVLDLDAEESPHVRPYDRETDGPLQDIQWGHDPAVEEARTQASSVHYLLESNNRLMQHAVSRPFKKGHLSDHDLMRVALLGGSSVYDLLTPSASVPRSGWRKKLLHDLSWNGIPLPILKLEANKVIPFILQRLRLVAAALKDKSLRAPEKTATDDDAFKKNIAECTNVYELSKLCSRIDSTPSGVELGRGCLDELYKTLLRLRQQGASSAEDALKLVNNVIIKRLASGKSLNRFIPFLALQLSSSVGLLPCILQHLQICLSLGIIDEAAEANAPTRSQVGRSILTALERGNVTGRGVREQIFTLTLGRGPAGFSPQRSLLGLFPKDHGQEPDEFDVRIRLLGELGAVRLLWHQWRGPDYDVFVTAVRRCAQVLSSAGADHPRVDILTVTGHVEQDAALDLRNINALDAIHAARGSKIPRPWLKSSKEGVSSEITPQTSSISAEEIISAFNQPILAKAVARLKMLIEKTAEQEERAMGEDS